MNRSISVSFKPDAGSSRRRSSGSAMRDRASSTSRWFPKESMPGSISLAPFQPHESKRFHGLFPYCLFLPCSARAKEERAGDRRPEHLVGAHHHVIKDSRVIHREKPDELKSPGKAKQSDFICAHADQVLPAEVHMAAVRLEQPVDHVKQSCFPRAIRPDKCL